MKTPSPEEFNALPKGKYPTPAEFNAVKLINWRRTEFPHSWSLLYSFSNQIWNASSKGLELHDGWK